MVCQKVVVKKEMVKTTIIRKANTIAKVYYSAAKKTKEILMSTATQLIGIAKERIEEAGKAIQEAGMTGKAVKNHSAVFKEEFKGSGDGPCIL